MYFAKWKKSESKGYMLYCFIYIHSGKQKTIVMENWSPGVKGGGVYYKLTKLGNLWGWWKFSVSLLWWQFYDSVFAKLHRTKHSKKVNLILCKFKLKKKKTLLWGTSWGTSLVVQWLRLHISNAGGSMYGQGTRCPRLQLRPGSGK